MKKYAFGIDIGGTTIKIGLFETNGTLLEEMEIPTRKEENGKFILLDISKTVKDKLEEKQIPTDEVEGLGVGVPGPVGADGTVFKCVNLGWDIINVEKILQELTGLKVKAGNDANVAALGEMWQGGGKGSKSIVMVTLGTGVGGGVVIDEHILSGIDGAAGEIGHLPMCDDETECCGCGKKGCLEQYASATGVVRMAKMYLEKHPKQDSVLKTMDVFTAKDIFDAAKNQDEVALIIKEEVGKMLGKALAMISCTVNPEVFVIGGGMSKAGDILIESIQRHYEGYAFHAARNTEIKLAKLSNAAGMYGCARMILE